MFSLLNIIVKYYSLHVCFQFFVCFSCFVFLFSVMYILCFVVFCVFFLLLCRAVSTIFVQVYRPLPPGGNPVAVNIYHIRVIKPRGVRWTGHVARMRAKRGI